MKFYLINPKLPLSFSGNEYAAPMVFKKYSVPPLGLLTVAGMIPEPAPGHDLRRERRPRSIGHRLPMSSASPGCTCRARASARSPRDFARRGKTHHRRRAVVHGGARTLSRYRRRADGGRVQSRSGPSASPTSSAARRRTPTRPADTVDLRTSPVPRFDLVSPRDYLSISLQTTRGCPFKCEFCDIITLYGRKVRTKPVTQVVQEVRAGDRARLGSAVLRGRQLHR